MESGLYKQKQIPSLSVYSTASVQLQPLPAVYHSDLWVIRGGGSFSQPLLSLASG